MKNIKIKMAAAVGLLFASYGAMAATQSVTANITFDTALSLVKNFDINFGYVTALQANTYKIDTAGAVTVTGGAGTGVWLGGTPVVGNIAITGSTTQTINITASNYVANNGVTPLLATCKYGAGAEAACSTLTAQAAPGASTTLLIGVSVSASGTQAAASAAAPTFDIVVTYT
jgi:hypothetical protein